VRAQAGVELALERANLGGGCGMVREEAAVGRGPRIRLIHYVGRIG
jgi:hypothetical protein